MHVYKQNIFRATKGLPFRISHHSSTSDTTEETLMKYEPFEELKLN